MIPNSKRKIFALSLIAALLPRAEAQETDPLSVIQRFNAAVKAGDVDATVALFADDAVIVNTRGRRFEGKSAIRAFWSGTIAEGASTTTPPTSTSPSPGTKSAGRGASPTISTSNLVSHR